MLATWSPTVVQLVAVLAALRFYSSMSGTAFLRRPCDGALHRGGVASPKPGSRQTIRSKSEPLNRHSTDKCRQLVGVGPRLLKRVYSGSGRKRALDRALSAIGGNESPPSPKEVGPEATPGCCGLSNAGNTCYQNSVLQCLNSVPGFVEYLRNGVGSDRWKAGAEVTPKLAALLDQMWSRPHGSVCSADGLRRAMATKTWPSVTGTQEDAHEFLTALLQTVRDEGCRRASPPKYRELPERLDPVAQAEEEWSYALEWNDSALDDVFGLQVHSWIVCPACGAKSHRFDYATELQLEIPAATGGRAVSLADCLGKFSQPEALEGYQCSGCGANSVAQKRNAVYRYPEVLVVTLKRFKYNSDGLSFRAEKVATPLEVTDGIVEVGAIRDPLSQAPMDPRYRLLAVCNHTGLLGFGHYTAVGRNMIDGRLRRFDDSRVEPVRDLSDCCAGAYLLFLQRVW